MRYTGTASNSHMSSDSNNDTSVRLPSMDPRIFLAVAMSGELSRPGIAACVWINSSAGSAAFMPIADVRPADLRKGLEEMHKADGENSYLFVNQIDARVHVFKHSKANASESLAAAMSNQKANTDLQ